MRIKQVWILAMIVFVLGIVGCDSQRGATKFPSEEPLYEYNLTAGTVTCSVGKYTAISDGDAVTLTAQANQGFYFVGWTTGNYLESYGELVSENSEFTFTKNGTVKYYANFLKDDQVLVCYYSNGGSINNNESQNDCLIQKVNLGKHLYPSTIPQNGTFSKEGYVLTEYASESDGSGKITNIGQRAFSDAKIIKLYVQWSKETDASVFTFTELSDGVYVTAYTGNEETLTIPAKYNGQDVVGIMQDAISSAKVNTVVLPETIKVIQDNAFNNCSSLKTVYLYDTVTQMTDNSFSGCPIETVCLNSVYDLKYFAEGAGKLELLYSQKDAATNRLVLLSGSSGIYGLDAKLLQSSLKKEFKVVNFGLQIAIPGSFSMRMMKDYLHTGDIVLFAPECEFKQFGNTLTTNTFIKYDGAYTTMRNVDISEYSSFFTALSLYSMAKTNDTEHLNSDINQFYDNNGDSTNTHVFEPFAPTYTFKSPTERKEMTTEVYKKFNDAIHMLNEKGVKIYLSFAPFCTEACNEEVTTEMLDAYSKTLADNLDVICISSQSAQNYPMKYFFEMFHMTAEGRKIRTEKLSQEINDQFDKEN